MSIEALNLSFTYNPKSSYEKKALDNISFSIKEGEFVGLIGSTGSGKSTLIQHLNGLIKLKEGSLKVLDIDLSQKKIDYKTLRSGIGMLFQYPEYQLFDETVLKDVMFGPKNFGMSSEQAEQAAKHAIELVGLDFEKISDRSPFELSGGQKRRVAIAGVLAYNPEILILDEPTAGLDPTGKKDILDLVTKLKNEKIIKTIVMISHNMDEIAAYTSRIIVLHNSHLIYDTTPEELFSKADKLTEIGLDLPQSVKIKKLLEKNGIFLDNPCLNATSLCKELTKKLGDKNG